MLMPNNTLFFNTSLAVSVDGLNTVTSCATWMFNTTAVNGWQGSWVANASVGFICPPLSTGTLTGVVANNAIVLSGGGNQIQFTAAPGLSQVGITSADFNFTATIQGNNNSLWLYQNSLVTCDPPTNPPPCYQEIDIWASQNGTACNNPNPNPTPTPSSGASIVTIGTAVLLGLAALL